MGVTIASVSSASIATPGLRGARTRASSAMAAGSGEGLQCEPQHADARKRPPLGK